MYSNVIWDFNGTIIDDVDIGLNALNTLLTKYGYKEIHDKDYYRSIFGFPIKDYYSRAGFDFSVIDYETLAPMWVSEYLAHETEAPIIVGVLDAMARLKAAGVRQYLVSATEINMLRSQLEYRGLLNMFDGIFGLDNIHASSKRDVAYDVVKSLEGESVMLGDTTHDAECAVFAGADVILVAAGHQSFEKLHRTGHKTVKTATEAIDIILGEK